MLLNIVVVVVVVVSCCCCCLLVMSVHFLGFLELQHNNLPGQSKEI